MASEPPRRRTRADLQLLALRETLRATAAALPLDDVLAAFANVAIIVADASTCWVMLAEEGRLRAVVARGELAEELLGKECDVQAGNSCVVGVDDRAVVLQPAEIDPADPVVGAFADRGEPVVLLPLRSADRALGLFGAAVPLGTSPDTSFLATVAAQMSATILSAQAREEARVWQQRLDLVFEQIADGVAVFGQQGRLALANAAARRVFDEKDVAVGDSLAEVIQKTGIADLVGRSLAPEETLTGRALAGAKIEDVELAIPMAGDTTHCYLFSSAPVLVDGRREGVVTVWRDVTAQKLAEADRVELAREQAARAAAEARAHLAAIVDSSDDAIVGESLDGMITSWNRAAERLYGYAAEEVIGQSLSSLVPPDRAGDLPGILERIGRGQRIDRYETVRVRKDGRRVDIAVTVSPIRDGAGRVIGASAIMSDISDRKRTEAALRESEERFRRLAEHAPDLIYRYRLRPTRGFEYVSPAATDIVGYTPEEHYADPDLGLKIVSPEDRPQVEAAIASPASLAGEPLVLRWTRKDGRLVWTEQRIVPVFDEAGNAIAIEGIARDITAVVALERQREEFIAVVAHDLRNAITTIKGYADLLKRLTPRAALPERFQRSAASIAAASRRAERMIADLLDTSLIEAHRLTVAKQPVDLSMLVKAIVERSEELTLERRLGVVMHGEIPPIEADPDRIEQVLSNLLSNAGKYSYPRTAISVDLEPRQGEVVVSVTSHGPGVPPAQRETIFDRFHRTPEAVRGKSEGLGLGLYIAKGLVEAHGGRIWVESEPGAKTTFRFTLPVLKAEDRQSSGA